MRLANRDWLQTCPTSKTSFVLGLVPIAAHIDVLRGGERAFDSTLSLERRELLEALADRGVLGGYDLSDDFPEFGHGLLVCATETRTAEDIETYATALAESMRAARVA